MQWVRKPEKVNSSRLRGGVKPAESFFPKQQTPVVIDLSNNMQLIASYGPDRSLSVCRKLRQPAA